MNSNWKLLPAALLTAVLALAGCGGGDDDMTPMPTPEEQCTAGGGTYADGNCKSAEQVAAEGAIAAAYMAAAGLDATSDDAAISAAESLIMAAQTAIAALSMDEAAENAAVLATAESLASAWRAAFTAQAEADAAETAEEQRLAEEEAARRAQEAEEQRQAAAAMMATAAKLYAGISAATGNHLTPAATDRAAGYVDTDGTPTDTEAGDFIVSNGDGTNARFVTLSEDEDAVVAVMNLHGWEGMRFTAEPEGEAGTYEAHVYSHVGEPMAGMAFEDQYSSNFDAATGTLDTNTTEGAASRVASSSFDQSAGVKTFELPDNTVAVMIPGRYDGVPGTYSCDPGDNNTCAVRVADEGFDLGGVVDATNAFDAVNAEWTFKPTDPEQKLMGTPDGAYASYGWWLHKSENDSVYTASAFDDYRGADENPVSDNAITNLRGTATYSGGAAGKYALHSTTGGTNDAGHFTADAELTANFGATHSVTGTVDNFFGADGAARDWSVELMESGIAPTTGVISGTAAANDAGDQMTVWTMDGTAADAAGSWSGQLHEVGDDGVPGIATGTFHSMFGRAGQMVGGFGATE